MKSCRKTVYGIVSLKSSLLQLYMQSQFYNIFRQLEKVRIKHSPDEHFISPLSCSNTYIYQFSTPLPIFKLISRKQHVYLSTLPRYQTVIPQQHQPATRIHLFYHMRTYEQSIKSFVRRRKLKS